MAKTEVYQIPFGLDPEQMRQELNRILFKFSDRIDRLEGIRGIATIQEGLTIETENQIVHGFNTEDEV